MFEVKEHLMDLKGKKYLQVMWRLVWFREEKPNWNIETEIIECDKEHAVFRAYITNEKGERKATGHGSESVKDFRDYIEKAETKAIGRALAMLGYGTQFAPELDEEKRIVDSPVEAKEFTPIDDLKFKCADCGAVLTPYVGANGKEVSIRKHCAGSEKRFGRVLCLDCINKLNENAD